MGDLSFSPFPEKGRDCFLVVGDKGEILRTCCVEKYVVRSATKAAVFPCVNAKDRDIGTLGREPLLYLGRDLFIKEEREHLVFFPIFFQDLFGHSKYLKLREHPL